MRGHSFVADEFYHIYSHSVGDLTLFRSKPDFERFLCNIFAYNSTRNISHLERFPGLNLVWDIKAGKVDLGESLVEIVGFCFMPNHFHLLLREKADGNISRFMHRILVSYSKYFNLKYEKRGHVFERTFNSRHLDDDNYLMRAMAYIHLNPKDLKGWKKKEHNYPWSSFQDYIGDNRWDKLLNTNFVLNYFENDKSDIKNFIEEAKKDDYKIDILSQT